MSSNGKPELSIPQNIEAERGVLGSILLDNAVFDDVATLLEVKDFFRDDHQVIYREIRNLHDQGKPVDAITLAEELTRRGKFKELGGDETLATILGSVPHAANARYYAQIVRQKSIGRDMIDGLNSCLKDVAGNDFTAEQLADRLSTWSTLISASASTVSNGRHPLLVGYKPSTFGETAKQIGAVEPLWEFWLYFGSLSMVWSKPKMGKTRIYLRVVKILWEGEKWPDGSVNPCAAGTKTLILPYDRNQGEIHKELQLLGVPDQAAVWPHDPRDPAKISLLSLTDPLMLETVDVTLADDPAIKLVVVDTLTYASERSMCKAEDMKLMLDGLMVICQKRRVALWVLCHENSEGTALGKRINEKARILMHLERYSEDDPTRLRLHVSETNFPKRPAQTVLHTDKGIQFLADVGPVVKTEGKSMGKAPTKSTKDAEWLWKELKDEPVSIKTLKTLGLNDGILLEPDDPQKKISLSPLYAAKDRIPKIHPGYEVEEFEAQDGPSSRFYVFWRIIQSPVEEKASPF
jgi:hypothetical protein